MEKLGLVELLALKRDRESSLWALGFRHSPKALFDTLCEIEKEIELRLEQIKELKKEVIIDIVPGLDTETLDQIYDLIKEKDFDRWLND
ncbi:MAG: hypothetical protein RR952_06650 [Cetobacterium sp.]